MTDFPVRWGGGIRDFKKWMDPSNGGRMTLEWGIDTPLRTTNSLFLFKLQDHFLFLQSIVIFEKRAVHYALVCGLQSTKKHHFSNLYLPVAKDKYIKIFGVRCHLFQSIITHTLPVILALKYSLRSMSQGSPCNEKKQLFRYPSKWVFFTILQISQENS